MKCNGHEKKSRKVFLDLQNTINFKYILLRYEMNFQIEVNFAKLGKISVGKILFRHTNSAKMDLT